MKKVRLLKIKREQNFKHWRKKYKKNNKNKENATAPIFKSITKWLDRQSRLKKSFMTDFLLNDGGISVKLCKLYKKGVYSIRTNKHILI